MIVQTDMYASSKERSCCQHYGLRINSQSTVCDNTCYAPVLDHEVIHGLLKQAQVRLVFNTLANRLSVQYPVSLSTRRTHCRAFSGVEDAELYSGSINRLCHRPTQSVYFPDDVTLADSADRGITGHLSDRLDVVCNQ